MLCPFVALLVTAADAADAAADADGGPRADGSTRMDTTLWLPTRAEPGPFGWSDLPHRFYHFAGSSDGDPDETGPEVDGGRISAGCSIERGIVTLTVTYVPSDYPDRLPEEMSCTVGRFDVHARITSGRPLYQDPDELQVDPALGAEVRRYVFRRGPDLTYLDHTSFALPPDVAWAATAEVPARRGGHGWADTTCAVSAAEAPVLTVKHTSHARDGWGRCVLADLDGQPHVVPVRLVTVER